MGRLDEFNITPKDFKKYGIETEPNSGLEFPTEYKKLCFIRDSKGKNLYHKCQCCNNLGFSFNQENYQINYFCIKDKSIEITIDNIQETRFCPNFIVKKEDGDVVNPQQEK